MLIVKIIENNTMYSVQELHLFLCSFSLAIFTSSIFSLHFTAELRSVELCSTNLSTNFFLHLQFSQSKYSPTSHDLSHSHSQLLGFQIDPLLLTPLSINYLHSHQHFSSCQCFLLLQTLAYHLHLHLHVSCHFMCLVSLVLDILDQSLKHISTELHSIELHSTDLHLIKLLILQKNTFLISPNIYIPYYSFSLNTQKCLKYHQLQ